MKKKWKRLWLKALRSNKYQQGRFVLRRGSGRKKECRFCPLGILADIICPRGWRSDGMNYSYSMRGSYTQLDKELMSITGLSASDQSRVMMMNDEQQRSFPTISRWIEEHL